MKYDNSKVRRQDRLLGEPEALSLLKEGEFGVLSMARDGNSGYGIPVNYVWDGKSSIYIHCAPEGEKLRCISSFPEVSFCIVGRTNVLSSKFTTEYESIVLECVAVFGLPAEERMSALKMLLMKYSPEDMAVGEKYAEKSFHRTEIIRLDIGKFSGKCKRVI